MPKCCFCERDVELGLMIGFWGPNNETKPICINCLKQFLESGGKETGFKNQIKKWLEEENFMFRTINESNHLFHYVLKDAEPSKISMEVFQERSSTDFIVGFMTFLSKELTFKIYQFSQAEKNEFKMKIDEFLSSIKIDYRSGMRVGYEMISDRGHYGAKYFIKSKVHDCNKEKFLKIVKRVNDTGIKSEEFLEHTLDN